MEPSVVEFIGEVSFAGASGLSTVTISTAQALRFVAEYGRSVRSAAVADVVVAWANKVLSDSGQCPICEERMDSLVGVFYHDPNCPIETYEEAKRIADR